MSIPVFSKGAVVAQIPVLVGVASVLLIVGGVAYVSGEDAIAIACFLVFVMASIGGYMVTRRIEFDDHFRARDRIQEIDARHALNNHPRYGTFQPRVVVVIDSGDDGAVYQRGGLRDNFQEIAREVGMPHTKGEAYYYTLLPPHALWREHFADTMSVLKPDAVLVLGAPAVKRFFPALSLSASPSPVTRYAVDGEGSTQFFLVGSMHPSVIGKSQHPKVSMRKVVQSLERGTY